MTSPIVPNRFIVHGNMVVKDRATGQDVTVRVADFIEAMKQRDEISEVNGNSYPRVCRGCGNEDPLRRVVSTTCGHVICVDCTIGASSCPHSDCRASNYSELTTFIPIFENADKSRDCGVCLNKSPAARRVLISCGHMICQTCNTLLHIDILPIRWINCPFCRVETTFKEMKEERIGPVITSYIPRVYPAD